MFSNKIIKREYEKNIELFSMIKEDENISENVKQRYLDYLRKREEELIKEKEVVENTINNLRELYENSDNEYLRREIKNNINELLMKFK
jgi:rubrerythrin